jgi:hypothetical protein
MHLLPTNLLMPMIVLAALFAVAYLAALTFIAAWTGSPYRKRTIQCPENHTSCDIEIDRKQAILTSLQGQRDLCVKSCDRWPEKQGCGQECVMQIEPSPSVLARIFSQWYDGKHCARCNNQLSRDDWDHGHVAVLSAGNLVEMREIPLEQLPQALVGCVPLCIRCHEEELAKQPTPEMFFKYDPRAFEMVDDPKFHN